MKLLDVKCLQLVLYQINKKRLFTSRNLTRVFHTQLMCLVDTKRAFLLIIKIAKMYISHTASFVVHLILYSKKYKLNKRK